MTGREIRRSLHVTRRRAAGRLAAGLAGQLARRTLRLGQRKPWREAVAAYLAHGAVHKAAATVDEDTRTLQGAAARNGRPARPPRFRPPAVVRHVDDLRAEHIEAYVATRCQGPPMWSHSGSPHVEPTRP